MMTRRQRASTRTRGQRARTRAASWLAQSLLMALLLACAGAPRADDTVVIASGADLESANPLVT
ncbi:MAG: hypothetical protein JWO39_1753, partial [Gemmatimonadetes bacterium]|nr:hypothetical protein [Gemmatimonadota bacterium]